MGLVVFFFVVGLRWSLSFIKLLEFLDVLVRINDVLLLIFDKSLEFMSSVGQK